MIYQKYIARCYPVYQHERNENASFLSIFNGGGWWFRGSRTGFSRPETMCHQKIVLKFKSIVMRTTNNLFRRVHNLHNCTHFKWWFTQFERKCNILEIFHYFQYFERFRSKKKMANFKTQNRRLVPWFQQRVLYHVKERYLFFQNLFSKLWATEKKIFEAKRYKCTFLKFELSRLGGPMLQTQKNAIRNQFEQQWFNVISYQKLTRVCRAIW